MSTEQLGQFADPKVLHELERTSSHAVTDHIPTLPSDRLSWCMSWLHLVLWHGMKSLYVNADKFPKEEYSSFREYGLLCFQFLVDHHDAEQDFLYPRLEARMPGSMEENEHQHHVILAPVDDIIQYFTKNTQFEDYEPKVLREKLDGLIFPLMLHLADELNTITGDKLRPYISEEEIADIALAGDLEPPRSKNMESKLLPFLTQSLPPNTPFPPNVGPADYEKDSHLWGYTAFPHVATA